MTVTVTEPQCLLPEITSSLTANGKVGNEFTYTITASSSKAVTFSVATSSLPAGLSFSGNTISGTPTEQGTFEIEISATNECGTDTETLVIKINPADVVHPTPTVDLTANPDSILKGQNSTLSWTSTNATECSATWTSSTSTSGSESVSPQSTTSYTITCTGPGGTATDTVTVTVTEPQPQISVSLSANPNSIQQGQSSTLSWSSTNAITCSSIWTNATSTSGTQAVSPNSTTEYSITCVNGNLSASATTTISVISAPVITTTGGGGGGGSSSSRRRTVVPEILGATTCEYLRDYLRIDWVNDPIEVIKLQAFLKSFEGFENLEINGVFDQATFDAVAIFQERYFDDILAPWGHEEFTGFVYILTKKKVNEIYCQRAFPLNKSQEEEIRLFRAFLESLRAQGIEVPSSLDIGSSDSVSESPLVSDVISDQDRDSILDTLAGSSDSSDTSSGGLIRNPAVRNVAAAVFSGPDGWADTTTAVIIFFLVVLAIYLAVNAVVKKNGSMTQVQTESLKIRKWMLIVGGLILAVVGCFIFKYYAIVLPLIALIIVVSSMILWRTAFKKQPAIIQAPLLKIDDK